MKTSTETAGLQRYSLNGPTMGSRYTALFYAAPGFATRDIADRLAQAVERVEQQMSSWNPTSDLNRLNSAPRHHWVSVPRELMNVITTALQVSEQSAGAFEIAVGELVQGWGFGPTARTLDQPALAELGRQRLAPASYGLELQPRRHRLRKRAKLRLDLNGIAKGFGVDELARALEASGIRDYLVGIDGEMRARGSKPAGQPWTVALEKPLRGVRQVMGVMELSNAAIATSGDYRRWVEIAGQSYAHTLDPATGAPLDNRLASVSVVAANCMLADAWATALLVLGEVEGPRLAQERGMDALFVIRDGAQLREVSIVGGQLQAQIETR
ncbi:FAD:protein FMN transferase [Pseudomonas chlororaphis]|uniref:FAD:protein FMN transferase n=1 Tax=Pseudomonas chlororaphis TaxID=587753 RepID=UPI0006A5BD7B|nr:FAD:protein FMN transferase [Pseudomonas chlororaphis]AZD01565.1 FAD:protein FMN transferase [Pseudomonas chlororaphis subsp. chlororaphis]MBM0284786.1 FAD:protein FMN transferase [Pseudomonas chlororaphis]MDO1508412.1 FAD:protein FMN transferase [Pseudomonas chlororaphis]ORM49627.1 thiamine biosynthesis protein ApbE [Pseudomonas chlororaphis subsp. chlororaphis]TWR98905.1 FAD:protein FMN transferase [Pseudomonas chlororaphis subsp. chlororaphis]